MIGLDTNILLRYITQDDPRQSSRATRLIERRCTKQSRGRITLIVLCELVWVMRGAYRYSKSQIVAVLDQILVTAEFEIENEELAWKALEAWKTGPADYSDYLLVFSNQAAGCEQTYTFDAKLARHPAASSPD